MSEKDNHLSTMTGDELYRDVQEEAGRRGISQAELQRIALRNEVQKGSAEKELELLRDELRDLKTERNNTEREISRIEDRIESLQKQVEGREAVNEEYEDLIEEIARFKVENNPNTYTVHQNWDRAVELSDQTEAEVRADVEDKIESLTGGSL